MENNTFVIIGTQWGDEGKGKIIDVLSPHQSFQYHICYLLLLHRECYETPLFLHLLF